MYNVLHFILSSTYAEDFIKFLNLNYGDSNEFCHVVYVYDKDNRMSINTKDYGFSYIDFNDENKSKMNIIQKLIYYKRWLTSINRKQLLLEMKKADRIVVHGLFENELILILRFHKKILEKTTIILWGADLYDHREVENKIFSKKKIIDNYKKYIFRNIKTIGMDMPTDYDLLEKWYGVDKNKTKVIFATYPQTINNVPINKDKHNYIILLGNSATRSNQHIDALELLKKFKDENIEIFCPLSYGDKNYAEQVKKAGFHIFRNKFIPIEHYMNKDQYTKLLSEVDIAIFNNNRQQAMGNINMLAYMKKKIYIRSDTSMWKKYVVNDKCSFFSVESISNINFGEFIKTDKNALEKTSNVFRKIFDNSYAYNTWKPLIEKIP